MYNIARTDKQIDEIRDLAAEAADNGSRYPGMSYEEGIDAFVRWVFGETSDPVFDDED